MKPTFIGIGAQKCASTWLYRILAEHPEVGVGQEKEIDFFSYHYDHGYQWYESQFVECVGKRAIGEISPSYFCEPAVPARIKRYLPDAKILVSFRDPVQRALSNHRHEVRVGHLTGEDLAFEAGLENNPMYTEQGRYATHLKRWLDHYPQEQILVVLQEDIAEDPVAVTKKVYEFVGVDAGFEPEQLNKKYNPSYANRSRILTNVKDQIYALTKFPAMRWLWKFGDMIGLKRLYRSINTVPSDEVIPAPNETTIKKLRETFHPEVEELSKILERSLEAWK